MPDAQRLPEHPAELGKDPDAADSAVASSPTTIPGETDPDKADSYGLESFRRDLLAAEPGGGGGLGLRLPSFQLGNYQVLRELGRGGMGIVYLALDPQQHQVALKTLPRADPAALVRFKQEFRALAGIVHPNLVTLYELGVQDQTWYFTMEFIQGTDFLTYVLSGSKEPGQPGRLRQALLQLVHGISALHRAGTLHRDIKPSNVMVTADGRVKLVDFGLAAQVDVTGQHQNSAAGVVGTVAYMSPEQAANLPVTAASDWYSVGVMLYQALTGRLPFSGSVVKLLTDKQHLDPQPPRALVASVAEDLNDLCVGFLSRSPAARPGADVVLQRLQPDARRFPAALPLAPFVGRALQLAQLKEAFQAVQQGRTVVLLAHGRSGAGKSALVQRVLEELRTRSEAVILAGRCYEHESVPYKAVDSIMDALSRYLKRLPLPEAEAVMPRDVLQLARVFPVLRQVAAVARAPGRSFETPDQQELRRRAFAALRELLARLGDRKPLVLFIDDLQWGDVDSAALLDDLLRPPDPPVLLLLGCYRSEEAKTSLFLRAFLEQGAQKGLDWRDLAVEALTRAEASELALKLLDRDDAAARLQADAIAAESKGNPFFVNELAHHLVAGAATGEAPAPDQEVSLDDLLWSRLRSLPEAAQRLLEIVAVAGQPLRLIDACEAARLTGQERTTVAWLCSDRLLRGTGGDGQDRIETYHDRIREAIIRHLSPPALADLHGRLGLALEGSGQVEPEILAVHFLGAGETAKAGEFYARAAARAAESLAFDRAANLYRLALELRPAHEPEHGQMRSRFADALANAGRGVDAAREYLKAAAPAGESQALELRRLAALQFLVSGHVDEGLKVLHEVLAAVGMKLARTPRRALLSLLVRRTQLWLRSVLFPPPWWGRVRVGGIWFQERDVSQIPPGDLTRIDICWSVTVGLSMIDLIRGADFQTRNLLLALRAGEPLRIVRALAVEACHVATGGGKAKMRAQRLLQAADQLAQRLDNPYARGVIALTRGVTTYLGEQWKLSYELSSRAEQIFRDHCTGVTWELDTVHSFSLWALNFLGEWAELSRRWPVLVQEARERGDLYGATNLSTYLMAVVRLAADDPDQARADLGRTMAQWSQQGYHLQHHNALLARVPIELYDGRAEAAWSHVSQHWQAFSHSLLGRVQNLRVQMLQMRGYSALAAALVAADPRPFLTAADRAARQLKRQKMAWGAAAAQYIQGAVAAARGDDTGARVLLGDAARCFQTLDMGLYTAATRRRLGQLLGGEEGGTLVAEMDAWMSGQQIRNPTRLSAVYAPGFPG